MSIVSDNNTHLQNTTINLVRKLPKILQLCVDLIISVLVVGTIGLGLDLIYTGLNSPNLSSYRTSFEVFLGGLLILGPGILLLDYYSDWNRHTWLSLIDGHMSGYQKATGKFDFQLGVDISSVTISEISGKKVPDIWRRSLNVVDRFLIQHSNLKILVIHVHEQVIFYRLPNSFEPFSFIKKQLLEYCAFYGGELVSNSEDSLEITFSLQKVFSDLNMPKSSSVQKPYAHQQHYHHSNHNHNHSSDHSKESTFNDDPQRRFSTPIDRYLPLLVKLRFLTGLLVVLGWTYNTAYFLTQVYQSQSLVANFFLGEPTTLWLIVLILTLLNAICFTFYFSIGAFLTQDQYRTYTLRQYLTSQDGKLLVFVTISVMLMFQFLLFVIAPYSAPELAYGTGTEPIVTDNTTFNNILQLVYYGIIAGLFSLIIIVAWVPEKILWKMYSGTYSPSEYNVKNDFILAGKTFLLLCGLGITLYVLVQFLG